jgi:ParB family chromosome partitioning protein
VKDALGRGLGALIPDRRQGVQEIEIKKIKPNPEQPRKIFDDQALRELTASIKEKGILQPVMVRKAENGEYYLIAGERRWRAAALSGLKKIPAMIKDSGPGESLELALIENIQRDDLNPIETAAAFHRLIEEHKYTQEDLSKKVGKERATVANYLRLLRLPPEVKGLINNGRLSMGHAKAIVSLPTKKSQMEASRAVVKKRLSVRETEALCKRLIETSSGGTKKQKAKDPDIAALEERLKRSMGTKVRIKHRGKAGKIEIEYYSLDELDRLLEILRA